MNRTWWIAAIMTSIVFGATYSIFSKFLLQWTIPETVILFSQVFAVLAAIVFFWLFPEVRRIYTFPNKKIAIMMLVAIFSGVLTPLLYMKWLSETLATNAIVTSRMSSIFMWIIWFLRIWERITWNWVMGTTLMFFWIIYITTIWFVEGFSVDIWVALVCIAALCSAIGHSIFKKYLSDIEVELAIFLRNGLWVIVFLFVVPRMMWVEHNLGVWLQPDIWIYFLWLALIPVFFSQYLRYSWLQHVPASLAGCLSLLSPLFWIMYAYVFLSEPLWWHHMRGTLCLLWGVAITMTKFPDQNTLKKLLIRKSQKV